MIKEVHFDTGLNRRLQPFLVDGDYSGLTDCLSSLSVANFRTAGYMIGERYAQELSPQEFWKLTKALVEFRSKAFLGTMLKAYGERHRRGQASVNDEGIEEFCRVLNAIDKQKVLGCLLPLMKDDKEVERLFSLLEYSNRAEWIPFLMQTNTVPCYYELFTSLRFVEDDYAYLVRIAAFIMKKGDERSYNLASLMKAYFGLDELKGIFSLTLKPYQLSRLENSYKSFAEIM